MPAPTYRLIRPDPAVDVPRLDADQRRVVDHPGGPLLVLAGPGTGKTTTLVEAIVERIVHRGARPDQVLALTFSRKAAEQLRDRVTARLGMTSATLPSATFHSFAYGLIRRFAPPELYAGHLTLLSAPEQDVRLRRLLTDAPESVRWPDGFRAAVGTRGFAREVGEALARARERGLDGEGLQALGVREGRPELVAAGEFLTQYLDVLDAESALDYPDLVARAVIEAEVHRDELRAQYHWVFVDEYQDTDPSQVRLLRALAGDGGNLVVVGDPDQSIYGFRGAQVRGIVDFPAEFPTRTGERADVVTLRATRRFGATLAQVAAGLARTMGVTGAITAAEFRAFRTPTPAAGTDSDADDGRIEVATFDSGRAETDHIADVLRRAHLEDGVAWSQMAVLVRSGVDTIPALRRSLGAAGVPVEVAADELPLVHEPAVQPLLTALSYATDPTEGAVEELLLSPLGGVDAIELRAIARTLRARHNDAGGAIRPSVALLDDVLSGRASAPADLPRLAALAGLLAAARAAIAAGASAHEVLWQLWQGTGWPEQLWHVVTLGGAAARLAHRDLDAVVALFEAAARLEEQQGHRSVAVFLDLLASQDLPADTLAERGIRGEAVRLLTAHRSKGLEWDLVVVAHVQEESWPDLRQRAGLLPVERLSVDGLLPPAPRSEQLAEERRLFYVACTRARHRLLVTAVASAEDNGEQPSRFLADLGVDVVAHHGRPRRSLSLAGLVVELRRTVADPATSEGLRRTAADRLAVLARETTPSGRPLVPAADPATWWGVRARSRADRPLRPEGPIRLSASALKSIDTCAAKWFFENEAGGAVRSTSAQGFGLVVHALADRVTKGDLDPGDLDGLVALVDEVWDDLAFRTPWAKAHEHDQMIEVLSRFLRWHTADRSRMVLAAEQQFSVPVTLPDGEQVVLRGYADRIEVDADDGLVIVDLKTGRWIPSGPAVKGDIQLGFYQYAADHGAFADVAGGRGCSGAELVQLRPDGPDAKVQSQGPDDPGRTEMEERLVEVTAMLREERITATAGSHCRFCAFQVICPVKGTGTVFDR